MATGVPPRDDEPSLSRIDLENIQEAMKQKKFREMFADYCNEVRDPANQALYQKEMTQLEKERGYDVTFINPKGGYVIKTSVAGDRKAFINICSNENVDKPSGTVQIVDGKKGMNWQLPYSLLAPREDYNDKREKCVIYDVVFHPDTLRMAQANKQFRELVNRTAFDGLAKSYNIHLDSNNCRFPKSQYKGYAVPAVIRTEDPNYKPPTDEELEEFTPEMIEKLYPQRSYAGKTKPETSKTVVTAESEPKTQNDKNKPSMQQQPKINRRINIGFVHSTENGYTIPKYIVKQQKTVDMQDYTYNKDCKQYSAIPNHLVVEINLPLLTSTKDCVLDVREKSLSMKSEKPAKYKLDITLPYSVDEKRGNATFDKKKHMLFVQLPVMRTYAAPMNDNSSRIDSGVESEDNSGSQSDDEPREKLIVELSSTPAEPPVPKAQNTTTPRSETFLEPTLGYILPSYTHNVLDDVIAFTFHVKNTEPDSVIVKKDGNKVFIKFTSIGSGFVPVHYAAIIAFDESVMFDDVSGEAWDNNVILQMGLKGDAPHKFQIGSSEDCMTSEEFDVSETNSSKTLKSDSMLTPKESGPVVEVTNLGSETNIVLSSHNPEELDEDDDIDSPLPNDDENKDEVVWTDSGNNENGAKSILRKRPTMRRYSESSVDVASSLDYVSSDCIPEESSLKKTVRFSDIIARQFYRYNSSIEGQKKKNQRRKSKKRQERRKSESEAEDEVLNLSKATRPKSAMKPRRDSGLADTSDAEADCKNTPTNTPNLSNAFEKYHNGNKSLLNIVDNDDEDNMESEGDVFEENKDAKCHDDNDEQKVSKEEAEESTNEAVKSVLNIVHSNSENKQIKPDIWEAVKSESDANVKEKKDITETETSSKIEHNTNLYDPEKLNKGHYLEVKFKNDLIFDLDM